MLGQDTRRVLQPVSQAPLLCCDSGHGWQFEHTASTAYTPRRQGTIMSDQLSQLLDNSRGGLPNAALSSTVGSQEANPHCVCNTMEKTYKAPHCSPCICLESGSRYFLTLLFKVWVMERPRSLWSGQRLYPPLLTALSSTPVPVLWGRKEAHEWPVLDFYLCGPCLSCMPLSGDPS